MKWEQGCSYQALNYDAKIDALTDAQKRPNLSVAGCCDGVFSVDGVHGPSGCIRQLTADGKGMLDQFDEAFPAYIEIDCNATPKTIKVITRLEARNKTADTRTFPGTLGLSDEEMRSRIKEIPNWIEFVWNNPKYRLAISDTKCGERIFEVSFKVEFVEPSEPGLPTVQQPIHFTVEFVNVDMLVTQKGKGQVNDSRESYVLPDEMRAVFNLADPDSVTHVKGRTNMEAHEYGHMIGLIDEYKDKSQKFGGCYYYFDADTFEVILDSGELMGRMYFPNSQPARYCYPIAKAVKKILEDNEINVTGIKVFGGPRSPASPGPVADSPMLWQGESKHPTPPGPVGDNPIPTEQDEDIV